VVESTDLLYQHIFIKIYHGFESHSLQKNLIIYMPTFNQLTKKKRKEKKKKKIE
jgi:hypothetical protein